MKNILLIGNLVIFILIFSGCSLINESNHGDKETLTESEMEESTEKKGAISQQKESPIDFGEEFHPPHFQVENFDVSIAEGDKLSIRVDYVFDQELFNFIKDKSPEYYYIIQYPSQLGEDLDLKRSDYIKGITIIESSSQMNYSIEIKEEVPEDYNINPIIKEPIGFQLIILNKNKYPVHIIDDIYFYSDFDPDLSQTIHD